jgi:hypothetical protein
MVRRLLERCAARREKDTCGAIEEEYQGKSYKKFKIARQEDKLDDKLEMILNRLAGLQLELQIVKAAMLRKEEAVWASEREF